MPNFDSLWAYAKGEINESTLQESMNPLDDDISEFENDPQFMQECQADCAGLIIQGLILGEGADQLDENVQEAIKTLAPYFAGQGMIDEAASVRITNPRINVVHLSKQAQIARLRTIITLKMARKQNHKCYKKYKLGQKIKKTNMEQLKKIYGAKAERLAKKLWAKNAKSAKTAAVVATAQEKSKSKTDEETGEG